MSEYGSFEELKYFTDLHISEDDDYNLLMEKLSILKRENKEIHGVYQIIFWCLDCRKWELAEKFYKYLTSNNNGEPLGDNSNAFIFYCLHKNNDVGVSECLCRDMFSSSEEDEFPYKKIEECMVRLGLIS